MHHGGVSDHAAASAAIDDAIARGMDLLRQFDAIVRNKYANNPAVLAEWTTASHVERAKPSEARSVATTIEVSEPGSSPRILDSL